MAVVYDNRNGQTLPSTSAVGLSPSEVAFATTVKCNLLIILELLCIKTMVINMYGDAKVSVVAQLTWSKSIEIQMAAYHSEED